VGDWLPEPVVVPADGPGPAEHAELADSGTASRQTPHTEREETNERPSGHR
jgi:hypothetical protein